MKGFIEVTLSNASEKIWFSVSKIKRFCDYEVNGWHVKETGAEIKALIEAAQKEDEPSFVITSNKCGLEMPDGTFRGFRYEEPQIVPLPYCPTIPYCPDVYRTVPMCDTVTHPVGSATDIGYVTSSTSMDAEGNVVAVELAQREDL